MSDAVVERANRSRIAVTPADPRDLDGDFGHRHRLDVRFGDTDAMGHVNNAVYLTFAEAGRLAWWCAATGEPIQREYHRDEGLILAEADVVFRSPVLFGEVVDVETRATGIGRTSISVDHRISAGLPEGPTRLVAVVRSVMVRYDYRAGRPTPWPDELVKRIETFEGRPLRD